MSVISPSRSIIIEITDHVRVKWRMPTMKWVYDRPDRRHCRKMHANLCQMCLWRQGSCFIWRTIHCQQCALSMSPARSTMQWTVRRVRKKCQEVELLSREIGLWQSRHCQKKRSNERDGPSHRSSCQSFQYVFETIPTPPRNALALPPFVFSILEFSLFHKLIDSSSWLFFCLFACRPHERTSNHQSFLLPLP